MTLVINTYNYWQFILSSPQCGCWWVLGFLDFLGEDLGLGGWGWIVFNLIRHSLLSPDS